MRKIVSVILVLAMMISTAAISSTSKSEAAVKGILNKTTAVVAIGKTVKLKVKHKGSARVSFSSSKKKIAKVSSKGTIKGIRKGKSVITVKVKKGSKSKKLKCKVTVVKGAKSLKVLDENKKKVSAVLLTKYETIELTTKISPKSSNDIVTWSSSNTDVATVKNGVITGEYAGKANVYAKTYSGKKVKIKVTVNAPAITGELRAAYGKDFKMGVATNSWQLEGIGGYSKAKALITSQFNSITMENQMKPESLLKGVTQNPDSETAVVINTDTLDTVLTLAQKNGLKVRGHCLVWHSQTPDWFFRVNYNAAGAYVSKEVMKARLENYIKAVVTYCQTKYPGVVYAWDVVNEAVTDDGIIRMTSPWYKVYGNDTYIDDAFSFARKYASAGVSLFYNDYNEYMPVKRDKIYSLVKRLYEAGNCDGVGMQSHYTMSYPTTALVKLAIQKYNNINPGKIQIQLTEMDIHNTYRKAAGQASVAAKYGSIMKLLVDQKRNKGVNITGVTFWGLTDSDTWLTSFKGETSYPLLFSGDYTAKSAFFSVLEAAK